MMGFVFKRMHVPKSGTCIWRMCQRKGIDLLGIDLLGIDLLGWQPSCPEQDPQRHPLQPAQQSILYTNGLPTEREGWMVGGCVCQICPVLKLMNFLLMSMHFVSKWWIFKLKMTDFIFKMMNFAALEHHCSGTCSPPTGSFWRTSRTAKTTAAESTGLRDVSSTQWGHARYGWLSEWCGSVLRIAIQMPKIFWIFDWKRRDNGELPLKTTMGLYWEKWPFIVAFRGTTLPVRCSGLSSGRLRTFLTLKIMMFSYQTWWLYTKIMTIFNTKVRDNSAQSLATLR